LSCRTSVVKGIFYRGITGGGLDIWGRKAGLNVSGNLTLLSKRTRVEGENEKVGAFDSSEYQP